MKNIIEYQKSYGPSLGLICLHLYNSFHKPKVGDVFRRAADLAEALDGTGFSIEPDLESDTILIQFKYSDDLSRVEEETVAKVRALVKKWTHG